MLPLETIIHKNSLNLFSSTVRNKHFIEYEIAERQHVMKGCGEKSWFNYIKSILEKYELPSVFSLFDQQISKSEWKEIMSNAVHSHKASAKVALKYVNPDSLKVGKAHPVWATVRNTISDNKRAQLKCKVLTGTYILQGYRAAFNQYTVDATCKL